MNHGDARIFPTAGVSCGLGRPFSDGARAAGHPVIGVVCRDVGEASFEAIDFPIPAPWRNER